MSDDKSETKRLYRCEDRKVIAGVCCGLADYFQIDPTLVRVFFVFLALFNGVGGLLYIILWIVIPPEHETHRQPLSSGNMSNARHWAGIIMISLGALAILQSLGLFRFNDLWPLLLILLGVFLIIRR